MESAKTNLAAYYVSFHIGCENYQELDNIEFKQVKESHNDVNKLMKHFKSLNFQKCTEYKDVNIYQKNMRENILKQT